MQHFQIKRIPDLGGPNAPTGEIYLTFIPTHDMSGNVAESEVVEVIEVLHIVT